MKKITLISIAVLLSALLLVGFSYWHHTPVSPKQQLAQTAIDCPPPVTVQHITDEEFKARYSLPAVMVRKNVYSLSAAEINSIKAGITAMKALPYTNPVSWEYQAAIHGTTRSDNLPSWNSCHKAGASFFFLAWHRMYVYFFERILRAKSGNPNLTVPYWNYQTNAVIPPDYRNSAAGNPLYDGTRSSTLNAGGSLPSSIMTSFANSLNQVPYYDFQTAINSPHGSVHTTINGNMYSTSTAALDPVFWLHHCNIDRLWEEWLRKCGGRANPTDNAWLTKTYTFFDENGVAVNMSGSQVVSTASQLNYKYDFPLKLPCNFVIRKWEWVNKFVLLKKVAPLQLSGQMQKANFAKEKSENLEAFVKTNKRARFDFTNQKTPEKLILTVSGIKIEKMPEGVIEVYLNLPAGQAPSSDSKYFVGLLDLFSAEHGGRNGMAGMDMDDGSDTELDVSKAAQAQGLSVADLKKAEVSFVVRGNSLRGKEVKTNAQITVKDIDFSVFRAKE